MSAPPHRPSDIKVILAFFLERVTRRAQEIFILQGIVLNDSVVSTTGMFDVSP